MTSLPIYFPSPPFDLQEAITCSALVDTAYDMYQQWIDQDKPDRKHFKWTAKGPEMNYSKPIWGAEPDLWIFKHKEPFAFVASSNTGEAYLVFRGTESTQDWIADAKIGHEPYALAKGYGPRA